MVHHVTPVVAHVTPVVAGATRVIVCLFALAGVSQDARAAEVRLAGRTLGQTSPGVEGVLDRALRSGLGRVHAFVQFHRTLTLEDHRVLQTRGVELLEYLGDETYVASIGGGVDLAAAELGALVRWAGAFRPGDKLDPAVALEPPPPQAVVDGTDRLRVLVVFFADVTEDEVLETLGRLDIDGALSGAANSWEIEATPDEIESLIDLDAVLCLTFVPAPPEPANDGGRDATETDWAQMANIPPAPPTYDGVSGKGVRIGICDLGIDERHLDFCGRFYRVDPERTSTHGTHMASIAAGDGSQSAAQGYPAYSLRGHAPEALIADYVPFGDNPMRYREAILTDRTDLTSHALTQGLPKYETRQAGIDRLIRGDAYFGRARIPARPQVWAAGNHGVDDPYSQYYVGYYSVRAAAKNSICVGSVDVLDRQLSEFSSLGPTLDGRLKPDVVAPGAWNGHGSSRLGINAAYYSADESKYAYGWGTSQATAAVSGIIALVMQQHVESYGTPPGDRLPSTYKALLVHTARDRVLTHPLPWREIESPDTSDAVVYHAGPDYATGYGLVDAEAARAAMSREYTWLEDLMLPRRIHTRCIWVEEGLAEIRATLAWDDLPGSCLLLPTYPKLVNDLDLELVAPDGTRYAPWVLTPPPLSADKVDPDPIQTTDITPAKRRRDDLNNVELVSVPTPEAGLWQVVVSGTRLPFARGQEYSLVTSPDTAPFCIPGGVIVDVCDVLEWLCATDLFEPPLFHPPPTGEEEGSWSWPTSGVLPVEHLRRVSPGFDRWREPGWINAPGLEIRIEPVPPGSIVAVFDETGSVLAVDRDGGAARILRTGPLRPGLRLYLAAGDALGQALERSLSLRIRARRAD